jgi:hypothetical protein
MTFSIELHCICMPYQTPTFNSLKLRAGGFGVVSDPFDSGTGGIGHRGPEPIEGPDVEGVGSVEVSTDRVRDCYIYWGPGEYRLRRPTRFGAFRGFQGFCEPFN